jgi:hypothetical protein
MTDSARLALLAPFAHLDDTALTALLARAAKLLTPKPVKVARVSLTASDRVGPATEALRAAYIRRAAGTDSVVDDLTSDLDVTDLRTIAPGFGVASGSRKAMIEGLKEKFAEAHRDAQRRLGA